jgi:hypothetical protein
VTFRIRENLLEIVELSRDLRDELLVGELSRGVGRKGRKLVVDRSKEAEDIGKDPKDLVGSVVNCRMCEVAIALRLVVVMFCKFSE